MDKDAGNKLIAEFMDFKVSELNGRPVWYDWNGASDVKYHSSWDWLMPVVEKANNLNEEVQKSLAESYPRPEKNLDDATGWRAWSYRYIHPSTDINDVWKHTIEFIQWYNQNKPQ